MKITFFTYKFPFKRPFITAKGTYNFRKGILICLQKDGVTAWGEAAPLPGFSRETLQEIDSQIHLVHPDIKKLFRLHVSLDELTCFFESHHILPSLQFGLFTLAYFYLAQKKPKNISSFLFPEKLSGIDLNAVVDLHHRAFYDRIKQLTQTGFQTIKVKVDNNPRFLSKISRIRNDYPHLKIRLDANQSWSLKQALNFIGEIEPLHIEYCEEPLANPDAASLNTLRRQTTVPIALDESLINNFSLKGAREIASVLIIKPMMLNLTSCLDELKSITNSEDTTLIFTSSLESGIGRLMTAILGAGFGAKNAAHGLSTGRLLANDVWDDRLLIRDHTFTLPDANQLNELMQIEPNTLHLKPIKL